MLPSGRRGHQHRPRYEQVGPGELRVVQEGAVVDGEDDVLVVVAAGGADLLRGKGQYPHDGQQRQVLRVRVVGLADPGVGEDPGQPLRCGRVQVEQRLQVPVALLGEAWRLLGSVQVRLDDLLTELGRARGPG